MYKAFYWIVDKVYNPLRGEKGAVGFEYMLIVGAVSVAVIVALLLIGPCGIAKSVVTAINTIGDTATVAGPFSLTVPTC